MINPTACAPELELNSSRPELRLFSKTGLTLSQGSPGHLLLTVVFIIGIQV